MNDLTAKDVMTRDVLTVRDDASISELVSLLSNNMITGVPVINGSGELVGVVSTTDVARESVTHKTGVRRDLPPDFYTGSVEGYVDDMRSFTVEEESDGRVGDIMTPVIFSVPPNASFAEMVDTMVGGRVHRVIVTEGPKVVGIVTTLDLLKALRNGPG